MHTYITNASIQLVPIGQDRHPYEWVDEAIAVIRSSGLTYEVGAFGTIVEGTYREISNLLDQINMTLLDAGCPEWVLNVQWQIKNGGDITTAEKTEKHKQ